MVVGGGNHLNPIDCGAASDIAAQDAVPSAGLGGPTTAKPINSARKFAYSLTDKYKGCFAEELAWKHQPGVYAASHVSSSDGGASYLIPSENERIIEQQQQQ